MDRRDFIKYSTGAMVGMSLLGPSPELFARSGKKDKYNVIILGDTHYDAVDPEKYHAGYHLENAPREANHRKEFVRNGKMWSGRCPEMVKRAACLVDDDTRFVLQMGDLIQGDTADAAAHTRFLDDAMNLFKRDLAPDLPFVTVAGNHDVRGNDDAVCSRAYADYMPVRLSKELGQPITDTSFLLRSGQDAYIVLFYPAPDLGVVENLLQQAEGARHIFLVVHTPVFPIESAKSWWWFVYGDKKDARAEDRRAFRRMLATRNAIVLCGHTHKTELYDWYGDGGRITQMTMSSVWTKEAQGRYNELISKPEGFGSLVGKKDPSAMTPAIAALFDEYRPGLRRFSWADAAGSYKLCVDDGVQVDFFAGSSARRSCRFKLR